MREPQQESMSRELRENEYRRANYVK